MNTQQQLINYTTPGILTSGNKCVTPTRWPNAQQNYATWSPITNESQPLAVGDVVYYEYDRAHWVGRIINIELDQYTMQFGQIMNQVNREYIYGKLKHVKEFDQ